MEMDPAGTSAKKMKLAAMDNHEAMPAPASTEALDATTTAERSEEPPSGAEGDGGEGSPGGISNLPDAVLGEIVSLLPTKDGARTQALASRWRHIWRAAPLNLDLRDLPDGGEALLGAIISAHQGPGRRLCLPSRYLLYQPNASICSLLRSPALDNLQELELYPAHYDYSTPSQQLPPPPETIFRFSSTLCVATISHCSLPDYMVETLRFPQLRKLALLAVLLSERALNSIIVASCPVLESLLLNSISGRLKITSPWLRSIAVHYSAVELIIEDAPLLQRLLNLDLRCMPTQISVISAPKLETLGCIPEFTYAKIVFGSTVIQGLHINSVTTVVRNVKILCISIECFDLDMVIDLMRCFPCLEKLYIKRGESGRPNLWRRKHRILLESLDIRLKTIVMGCYRGIKAQVNFAQFFVLNARILESLKLEVRYVGHCNDVFFAEQHKILQMEKRASRGARLSFKQNCQHGASSIVHLSDLDSTDPFACGC